MSKYQRLAVSLRETALRINTNEERILHKALGTYPTLKCDSCHRTVWIDEMYVISDLYNMKGMDYVCKDCLRIRKLNE